MQAVSAPAWAGAWRRRGLALAVFPLVVAAVALGPSVPAGASGTTSDRSPVDLATPIDLGDGMANQSAIVRSGDVRIEVLSPTLLRLEYSPTGDFENLPTVNALNRRMPVPPYQVRDDAGWLTVKTSRALLRYRIGSGPFTTANTTLVYSVAGRTAVVHPAWDAVCTFNQVCQAGSAELGGGDSYSQTQGGYESASGYVGYMLEPGTRATWRVLGAPSGPASVTLRYSNVPVPPTSTVVRNFDLLVNGRYATTLTADRTDSAEPWSTLTTTVALRSGVNTVEVRCGVGEGCDTDIDTLSVSPVGSPLPVPQQSGPLGGWIRGFDTATYNDLPTCSAGQQGATCVAGLQPLETDGLLDTVGWRLLDDSQSAVWTKDGWVRPRGSEGDQQDGYLFVYGHDYTGALRTLAQLTGPAPLLPRSIFGVWYSDYTPYSSATIEHSLYPTFVANHVPLNTMSLDTDWKAPNNWNGWEWNASLFPDPARFLQWAGARDIHVTLNVHSSIEDNDPKLPAAERVAGGTMASSTCSAGNCKVWDWSSIAQAESNFSLQQSFEHQGVSFWWLDWCCDVSTVSMTGVTPDSWIDHLYAQEMVNKGQRGFVLGRIGGSNGEPEEVYPAGPWSDHTSAIAFTGDAWGTWNTLAQEAVLTASEATIGEPYVSSDVGSFLGPPPTQSGADPPDLYDRWVQLGTFQPILRLHSNNEDRLPWQYPQPVQAITEDFLRLREALIPYTYTLAARSNETGLPMARPLYLDYPDLAAAYQNPTEYLYGPDVLVAPVTSPGAVAATTVWFPPGRWVDYFTGATFTGPSDVTLSVPLSRMPVFVRPGGIIPEQSPAPSGTDGGRRTMTIKVYAGSDASFRLYDDAGTGLGYTKGQDTETMITTSTGSGAGSARSTRITIGPALGHYPGQPTAASYRVQLVDVSAPRGVTLDGRALAQRPPVAAVAGWSYDASTATLTVVTGSSPTTGSVGIVENGGLPVDRAEPTVPASS